MQEWIVQFLTHHPVLVYGFFALLSSVEGPILAMLAGVLLHLGYLSFAPVYITLMAGDLLGDIFWYLMGRHFGDAFVKRFGEYFSLTEKNIRAVRKIFHKYQNHILIISKITMGFGFAVVTLFTAGLVKVPFRQYITLNAIGQFVWTGFLLAVGYLFGNVYESVNGVLGKMTLIAAIVIAFLALVGYGKYIRSRMSAIAD